MGGELIKKRVARAGGGKSGGYRTTIAYRQGDRAFFLHGFAKNERANVSPKEVTALKVFARCLNVGPATVQKWEQGAKKPSGASLRLLQIVEAKSIEALLGA